jgi:hypothetical protein
VVRQGDLTGRVERGVVQQGDITRRVRGVVQQGDCGGRVCHGKHQFPRRGIVQWGNYRMRVNHIHLPLRRANYLPLRRGMFQQEHMLLVLMVQVMVVI